MDSAARICPDVLMEAGIHHHLFRRFQSLKHSMRFPLPLGTIFAQFLLSPSILSTFTFHIAIERFLRHVDPRIRKKKAGDGWSTDTDGSADQVGQRGTPAPCSETHPPACAPFLLPPCLANPAEIPLRPSKIT